MVRVRSMSLPGYRSFSLGLPDAAVERAVAGFRPDVVHLASPIMLGAVGLRAARRLGIPTVAVYQTDVAAFARQYGVRALPVDREVGGADPPALVPDAGAVVDLPRPSSPPSECANLHVWRRGVSLDLFGPQRRSAEPARSVARRVADRVVVGYVGRLAAEKQVRRLVELADLPGTRLVVVGDGPLRAWLEQRLPGATFTGMLGGAELATAFASLDVFVHTGEAETFCQTVQEAQASGVPVVAPAAGGPLDLVRAGHTGLLYDPSDPASLRRAVETAGRTTSQLRRRLAPAGARAGRGPDLGARGR